MSFLKSNFYCSTNAVHISWLETPMLIEKRPVSVPLPVIQSCDAVPEIRLRKASHPL